MDCCGNKSKKPMKLNTSFQTLKGWVGVGGGGEVNFSKKLSSKERGKPCCFFVTFNIIIKHIFSETFIETPLVVQKI